MSQDGLPKKPPAAESQSEDWRTIAGKAANERDPHKLVKLVEELCKKLDERPRNS